MKYCVEEDIGDVLTHPMVNSIIMAWIIVHLINLI